MPKISAIVPIYNVEKYLKEALDSLLSQTLNEIEIILIDDGSKDNSAQIIDEYARNDNRIVVIHKNNGGYGQSMNLGIQKATGEYIAILEPDDYIDKNMYEDLYNIAKKFDSDIVKSSFYYNLQDPKVKNKMTYAKWDENIPEDRSFNIFEYPCFFAYHPSVWSAIYKRSFLIDNNILFKEIPGAGWSDNPFQIETLCLANKINYTSKAYYYWRILEANPADELKDCALPIERTKEIHQWFFEKNINDNNIFSALFERELSYIYTLLEIKQIKDKKYVLDSIKTMIDRMDSDVVLNSKYVSKRNKKMYINLKRSVKMQYLSFRWKLFNNKLKKIRKKILQLKFSKDKKYIVIFGKVLYKKGDVDV